MYLSRIRIQFYRSKTLLKELKELAGEDENAFSDRCDSFGIFTDVHTLEVDLFQDEDFTGHVIDTLREQKLGAQRRGWIDKWEADPEDLDVKKYLSLIEAEGKGPVEIRPQFPFLSFRPR